MFLSAATGGESCTVPHYGEKKIVSIRFVPMEMVAILDFRALTKVHKLETASSNAVKSWTHLINTIGFYREIAIAIQDEVGDSNGGNV